MRKQSLVSAAISGAVSSKQSAIADAKLEISKIRTIKGTLSDIGKRIERQLDGLNVRMYVSCLWGVPELRVRVSNVDGFKNEQVMAMFETMTDMGFESRKTHEYPEWLERNYPFKRIDVTVAFDICVKSDSPTCRKVAIGEETVTQTKYAIQCD
jgi:hypothetical protein